MANYDASSTNKSKKSTRTYVDLDLDFTRHPVTNDVVKITDVEAVKRSVKNLINTQFYERPFHPELGCGVRDMLFENYTPMTGIFMRRKIEEVLSNYEPRASLSSIQVNEQMDRNAIDVVVNFYVLNLPNPVSVTTTLQRIR
jgi:phage baseplate assembly protein W|tara:strand:+ start:349 stop:774 length:426 start_codon:yes stop_codon:yes gene_type:complete